MFIDVLKFSINGGVIIENNTFQSDLFVKTGNNNLQKNKTKIIIIKHRMKQRIE